MNKQVVIYAKAGHVPPEAYLKVALKECPTYYGLAIRENGDNPTLEVIGEKKTLDLPKLVSTMEELKDTDTVLVLGNMTQDFDGAGDMMPFTFQQVTEEDGKEITENVLVAAFEGDFPNYSAPGKGHTDEFNMWDKFIFPELMDKFEASQDLPTFYKKIGASNFEQALLNPVGHRAQFFFLPLVGDPIICHKNELGGEFDWGGTSMTFDWNKPGVVEATKEAAKTAVAKGKSRLQGLMGGAAAPAAPAPEPQKSDPPGVHRVGNTVVVDKNSSAKGQESVAKVVPPVPKKDTAVKEPYTMVEVPSKLNGNARNKWIRLFAGLDAQSPLPEGHQSKNFRVAVPNNIVHFTTVDVSTQDQVRKLVGQVKAFQDAGTVTGTEAAHQAASQTNAGKATIEAKEPSASDYLPVMSADTKKGAGELVIDWATRDAAKAPTAVQIQSMESKWQAFSEQMGITFADLFKWTAIDVKTLGKKYPEALGLAFIEMRRQFVEYNGIPDETWEKKDVKNPEPGKQDTKVSPPPVAPSQPAGTQTTKKGRLAALTGAA